MRKSKHSFLLVFLLIGLFACNRDAVTTEPNKKSIRDIRNSISDAEGGYYSFASKVRVNYEDQNRKENFTASLRMVKDSLIWMSLSGPLGIEGGRVKITRDSLFIIDRINKHYYSKPFGYISTFLPFPYRLDLPMLQRLLYGASIVEPGKKAKVERSGDQLLIPIEDQHVRGKILLDPREYTIAEVEIGTKIEQMQVNLNYSNYKPLNEGKFSHERQIKVQGDAIFALVFLDFGKISLDKKLNFPFRPSDRYKRID